MSRGNDEAVNSTPKSRADLLRRSVNMNPEDDTSDLDHRSIIKVAEAQKKSHSTADLELLSRDMTNQVASAAQETLASAESKRLALENRSDRQKLKAELKKRSLLTPSLLDPLEEGLPLPGATSDSDALNELSRFLGQTIAHDTIAYAEARGSDYYGESFRDFRALAEDENSEEAKMIRDSTIAYLPLKIAESP